MRQLRFGVLGAGVVGLTTALELQSQFPNAEVSLFSEKFNEFTTSDVAAGIFRPGTSFCTPSEEATRNELIEKIVPVYRSATEEELRLCPGVWKFGSYFSTVLTECTAFLPWCLNKFRRQKGRVVPGRLNSWHDLEEERFEVIVNCLGLGAKEFCRDRKVVPIRGQVLKVRAPWLRHFFYADYDTYIIPGRTSVTLGGCRNYDSYDETVSSYDTQAIWDRCTGLVPGLKKCAIDRIRVGLRPHRDPVRLERETVNVGGRQLRVVHNYGHGGYGVTTAPGSAKYAVLLVKEALSCRSKI